MCDYFTTTLHKTNQRDHKESPRTKMLLSVLSLVALGALEQCVYTDLDPNTKEDCSGNVNAAQCAAVPDDQIGKCTPTSNGFTKGSCSGSTIKMQFHAKADCSDDTSAKCVIDILDPTFSTLDSID